MSALLAIDIGNSTIGFGLFPNPEKNTKLFIKKIPTHPALSVEAYKKIIAELINSKLYIHKSYDSQRDMKNVLSFPDLTRESRKKELDSLVKPENDIFRANSLLNIDSIISSVVPPIDLPISEAAKAICGKKPLFLSHKTVSSMAFEASKPSEVGTDRIANAVAGLHYAGILAAGKPHAFKNKKAAAVVDFGTATTITVCAPVTDETHMSQRDTKGNENVIPAKAGIQKAKELDSRLHGNDKIEVFSEQKQRFIGGAILPGISLMLKSLYSGTSKLPLAVLKKPDTALGKNTVSSIISGIVHGSVGAVEHLIKSMEKETGFKLKLVLTGGHAGLMSPLIKQKHRLIPELTFYGLRLIYLKAKSRKQ